MKRLLLCSSVAPWPNRPIQGFYHISQANALAQLGVEVEIFNPAPRVPRWTGRFSSKCQNHIQRPETYQFEGVRIHSPRVWYAFPRWVRLTAAPMIPNAVAGLTDMLVCRALDTVVSRFKPDAILAHGIMPWGQVVSRCCRRHGIPFAFIEHSSGDVLRLQPNVRLTNYYTRCANEATATFVVGPQMVSHLQSHLDWPNVVLLPNGVEKVDQSSLSQPRPSEYKGKQIILAAAQYYRRKGIEELVEAFIDIHQDYPNACLCIVSNIPTELRTRIDSAGLGSRIRLFDLMPRNELRQWMAWADLFALPSWSEAFGLVYAEAMSVQTPVLMTNDCGMAGFIQEYKPERDPNQCHGWVIEPHRKDSLVAALREALPREDLLEKMGVAGQGLVEDQFTWENNARILLQHIQGKILADEPSDHPNVPIADIDLGPIRNDQAADLTEPSITQRSV